MPGHMLLTRMADLLVPRLIVAHAPPAVGGEHHLDADLHKSPPARAQPTGNLSRPFEMRLSQRELAVPVCRHRIAVLAKGGVAAAVAHDLAGLLALDVAVDAGHPGVDLVHQQTFARR